MMTNPPLDTTLRLIVQEHGIGEVLKSLGNIVSADTQSTVQVSSNTVEKPKGKRSKTKTTATEHVAKMELLPEKYAVVSEIAERFERKEFLPTFGDVRNFCDMYNIDVPASRTRVNAIPRVFKFLAHMNTEDIQRILDDRMFSGPSRLGPIADAIRRNGRANR